MARPRVLVVGAGIVGLAAARALARCPSAPTVTVLEKEDGPGLHQTGHNSGVLHSGVYYRPGSLKSELTRTGRERMETFCRARGIPIDPIGKVIVASTPGELPALEEIARRGRVNGVPGLRWLDEEDVRAVEPEVHAVRALHVPTASVLDYAAVGRALREELGQEGVELRFGQRVEGFRAGHDGIEVDADGERIPGDLLVNCAGLFADRVAEAAGVDVSARIVPFRGEYYRIRPERSGLVRGLIYPVPDPALPFLGVHLTRRIGGEVEAGPNAVLALAREGYRWRDVDPKDLAETLTYPGLVRMARRFGRTGISEAARSLSRRRFLESVQRLVPSISADDLVGRGSGVRAQAVGRDGRPLDDFLFERSPRALHVVNAPSPGATASLAIGERIASELREDLS